jgi:hypothetical protein
VLVSVRSCHLVLLGLEIDFIIEEVLVVG